jgi:hypothetical protein
VRRSDRDPGTASDGHNLVRRRRATAAASSIQLREHPLNADTRHAEHEHAGIGVAFIAEGMLPAARAEEERPRTKPLWRGLIGAQNELAGQHIEGLVLVCVGMRRHPAPDGTVHSIQQKRLPVSALVVLNR